MGNAPGDLAGRENAGPVVVGVGEGKEENHQDCKSEKLKLSYVPRHENWSFGFPIRSNTNKHVQSQKKARIEA